MTATEVLHVDLTSLDDDQFRRIVDEDIRYTTTKGSRQEHPRPLVEAHRALRQPENVDRWFNVLLAMKKNVEGQIANEKAKMAAAERAARSRQISQRELRQMQARYDDWRQKSLRFANGLDLTIVDAKRARSLGPRAEAAMLKETLHECLARIRLLEETIRQHRIAEQDAPRESDVALWEVLGD